MNADFERDKGTYPYGPVRRGDSYYLTHIPSQEQLCVIGVPALLAVQTANRLNALYYKRKELQVEEFKGAIKLNLLLDARTLLDSGELDATHYQGIVNNLHSLAD